MLTARPMRLKSSTMTGKYMPLRIVAYASGNAAKSAPPKVTSHTSLPSQSGPMLLMASRFSVSPRTKG